MRNKGSKGNHQKNQNAQPIIEYPEMYKITFDGLGKVGKTSLMKKYLEDKEFKESQKEYAKPSLYYFHFWLSI